MADLTEIIQNAVDDASTGGTDTPDTSSDVSTSEPTVSPTEPVSPSSESAPPPLQSMPHADTQLVDESESALAEYGIKPPMEGQRENRLPYTRVKKIVENATKKEREASQKALADYTEKMKAAEADLEKYRRTEQMAMSDPDRYLTELSRHDPRYARFLQQQVAAAQTSNGHVQTPPAPASPTRPMPKPIQQPDGSFMHTDETLADLMAWQSEQTEARLMAKFEADQAKRFGPIEKEWQQRKAYEAHAPIVQQQIADAKAIWGELFTKHEADILTALKADTQTPFAVVVQRVLVPKLQSDRTKMREEIHQELSARPAAAQRAAPASVSGADATAGPKSIEDVIRASLAAQKASAR